MGRTLAPTGHELPIFDGIDLNTADAGILSTYLHHKEGRDPLLSQVMTEEELLAELQPL